MFDIIKAEIRTSNLIEWFSGICPKITDFVVGSKIRSKFETVAVEMEAQDFAWYTSLRKAIPIAIYRAFDFSLKPAQTASGYVTFYAESGNTNTILIPAGTEVGALALLSGITYKTIAAGYITPPNISVDILVEAVYAGQDANIGSGMVTEMVSSVSGVAYINNQQPITGGAERENEEQRRLRFIEYVASLARGTIAAVEFAARMGAVYDINNNMIESVRDAIVYEPFMHDATKPVGVFEIYIYNGYGNTSDELLADVQKQVDGYVDADGTKHAGWKAAGVIANIISATETVLDVEATLVTLPGFSTFDVEDTATIVIDNYISNIGIGKQFIYNELIERLMAINGVYNCSVLTPTADMTPEYNEVYVAGNKTIDVTERA